MAVPVPFFLSDDGGAKIVLFLFKGFMFTAATLTLTPLVSSFAVILSNDVPHL